MTEGLLSLFGTGLGLSTGAGLNAYAVLLVYGGMARFFPEDYPGRIAQLLGSTPALIALAALFVLEFFVDKIPGADHVWDVIHTVVRPIAGALLAVAVVGPKTETPLTVLAGGTGGVLALAAHLLKSATRLTSTAITAGVANVALSLAEDVLAFLQAFVSIFLPMVALAVVVALGVIFLLTVPRIFRTLNPFDRRARARKAAG